MTQILLRALPFMSWVRNYDKSKATADLTAGLTVAVVLIPQAMAYAILAGLPPVYGLYAGLIGAGIGALFGSSTLLSTGPVAIVSFLVLTSLTPLATPETPEYIALALLLAFMVGIIQFLMGLFRFGFIMNFVSHSVIVGFSSAAAIIIGSTQIPSLLGIKIEQHELVFQTFIEIFKHIPETNLATFMVGIVSIIAILLMRRIHKAFPAALIVVVVSIFASTYFHFEAMGIKVVGSVPSGIPFPAFPELSLSGISGILSTALVISIIGFMEAYAIAKALAAKRREQIDVNQELMGQGLANIIVSFFKGYPVSGSFSRSAVNDLAGAKTGMSSVFVSIFVLLTLLFLSSYLYNLPKAVLASIVIVAVSGLVDLKKFAHLWKIDRNDGIIAITTFSTAFLMKPDYAIFIGIILSLVLFLRKSMSPHVAILGRNSELGSFTDVRYDKKAASCPYITIVRPNQSVYFGNVENVLTDIKIALENNKESKIMIFDGEAMSFTDASALETLEHFIHDKHAEGISFIFTNIRKGVEEKLIHSGIAELVGKDSFVTGKGSAIQLAKKKLSKMGCKKCGSHAFKECE